MSGVLPDCSEAKLRMAKMALGAGKYAPYLALSLSLLSVLVDIHGDYPSAAIALFALSFVILLVDFRNTSTSIDRISELTEPRNPWSLRDGFASVVRALRRAEPRHSSAYGVWIVSILHTMLANVWRRDAFIIYFLTMGSFVVFLMLLHWLGKFAEWRKGRP